MLKENKERFGLRKLSVGLASVVLGVTTMSVAGHTVHADTLNDRNQGTNALQNNDDKTADSDTQKSAQVVKEVKPQVEKVDTTTVRGGTDLVKNTSNSVASNENNTAGAKTDAENTAKVVETVPAQNITNKKTADNQLVNENNNNAKENSVKESLTKDADKNVATQSFNVQKNSKIVLSKDAVKTNLIQESSNDDWADPAKNGFHKTNVGWTKHNAGDGVYNAIADKSVAELHVAYDPSQKPASSQDVNITNTEPTYGINFKDVIIKKSDLTAGNTILIDSIAYLYDKSNHKNNPLDESQDWNGLGNTVTVNGYDLGYISNTYANDERDYVFNVTKDENILKSVASDLHFSFDIAQSFASNQTAIYGGGVSIISDVTQGHPLNSVMINNNTDIYRNKWYMPTKSSETFSDIVGTYTDHDFETDVNGNLFIGNFQEDSRKPHQNINVHRIFKYQSTQPMTPNLGLFLHAWGVPVDENGKVARQAFFGNNFQILDFKKAPDDMSINDLYNSTRDKELKYSKQSNGSYLICVNINTDDLKFTDQQIIDTTKSSTSYVIASSNEQKAILQRTLDYYHKRGNHPLIYNLAIYQLTQDQSKPYHSVVNEVTPDAAWDTSKAYTFDNKPNGASADMSMYRTYNVQYKDIVTGDILRKDIIMSQTGNNVDYHVITSDQYQLAPDQVNEITFRVPNDEKVNPDPIVINVLGKEDYERDRTYKVIIKKPDHKDGTIDNTYATYTMKMTRHVTGRDSNDKITFDNWTITDGNGTSYTYDPTNNVWESSTGSTADIVIGSIQTAPQNADFAVDGYTAHSDIAIDGITLNNFADKLKNSKDKIEVTNNGQLLIHTADFANPDKILPNGTTFYVTYTANKQSMTYKFVDDDEKQAPVGSDIVLNGVTDQLIDTGLTLPANYKLADGNTMPTTYQFSTINAPVTIHLKHVTTPITDPTVLNGTSTRTFHVHYPEGRGDETIVQIIKMNRTGQFDHVLNKPLYTDWVVDHDNSKVTVNNNKSDLYQACMMKGKAIMFAPITLPRIPGYTAKVVTNSIQPNVYLVSFIANALPQKPIDPHDAGKTTKPDAGKDNKGETIKPEDSKTSKGKIIPNVPAVITPKDDDNKQAPDWVIKDENNEHYTVSNNENTYDLPVIKDSSLAVIKTGTTTLAFTYVKFNQPNNYIFMITKRHKMYQLTVSKFDDNGNLNVVKVLKSHNYKNLLSKIKLYA